MRSFCWQNVLGLCEQLVLPLSSRLQLKSPCSTNLHSCWSTQWNRLQSILKTEIFPHNTYSRGLSSAVYLKEEGTTSRIRQKRLARIIFPFLHSAILFQQLHASLWGGSLHALPVQSWLYKGSSWVAELTTNLLPYAVLLHGLLQWAL